MAAPERLICASEALVDGGQGVRFLVDRAGAEHAAFVVRHKGVARAYLNRCGHVPVELDREPGRFFDQSGLYFVCATHGALYAPESGRCVGGRCNGRGLVPLDVAEHDGGVFLLDHDVAGSG